MRPSKKKNTVLCLIMARGGSKGVIGKNIKPLNGKPLIAYTIEAVRGSGVIDRLVVSTDDVKIGKVAQKFGAEVIKRPNHLSRDASLVEPGMLHALGLLEKDGYAPDFIALAQCTSPFLTSRIVRQAVLNTRKKKFNSCLTVGPLSHGHNFKWDILGGGRAVPRYNLNERPPRQKATISYIENGAFYITTTELFKKNHNRIGGNNAIVSVVKMSERDSLQIDSLLEFFLAEKIMKMRATKAMENR